MQENKIPFMTTREAAEKWGISIRRVNTLCQNNRLVGALKFGYTWLIPSTLKKPQDLRYKTK